MNFQQLLYCIIYRLGKGVLPLAYTKFPEFESTLRLCFSLGLNPPLEQSLIGNLGLFN